MYGSFNSKLVRLKGILAETEKRLRDKFQFQTGSIKSLTTQHTAEMKNFSFNSKLVRLKGFLQTASTSALTLFQFQTGSIKS